MTLQERLVSEVEENLEEVVAEALGYKMDDGEWKAYDFYGNLERITDDTRLETIMEAIRKHTLHTIEQTIKEGCDEAEKIKKDYKDTWFGDDEADRQNYNNGVTDSQHALRGIIK